MVAGFLPFLSNAQENIPEKTQNLYEKAMKLLEKGKEAKAEKQFTKILVREQHGRSLFQVSKIESENGSSPGMILPKLITAHRLMKEEFVWLERSSGNEYDMLKLTQMIEESVEMIHNMGGKTLEEITLDENPNFDPDNNLPSISESESKTIWNNNNSNVDINIGNDGSIHVDNNTFLLFPQGSVSTFFLINELLPEGSRLPSEAELEKVLMSLLSSTSGRQYLNDQYHDKRKTLKFISNSLFFDNENNQLVKGFQLKKSGLSLESADIEPGDSSQTFLIITP
jgi:hypothetical protein